MKKILLLGESSNYRKISGVVLFFAFMFTISLSSAADTSDERYRKHQTCGQVESLKSIFESSDQNSALDSLTRSRERAEAHALNLRQEQSREIREAEVRDKVQRRVARQDASVRRNEIARSIALKNSRKKLLQGIKLEISVGEYLAAKGHNPECFARKDKRKRVELLGRYYTDVLQPQISQIAKKRGYSLSQKVSFEQNLFRGAYADIAKSHSLENYVASIAYHDAWKRLSGTGIRAWISGFCF